MRSNCFPTWKTMKPFSIKHVLSINVYVFSNKNIPGRRARCLFLKISIDLQINSTYIVSLMYRSPKIYPLIFKICHAWKLMGVLVCLPIHVVFVSLWHMCHTLCVCYNMSVCKHTCPLLPPLLVTPGRCSGTQTRLCCSCRLILSSGTSSFSPIVHRLTINDTLFDIKWHILYL